MTEDQMSRDYVALLDHLRQRGITRDLLSVWLGVTTQTLFRRATGQVRIGFEAWCSLYQCVKTLDRIKDNDEPPPMPVREGKPPRYLWELNDENT